MTSGREILAAVFLLLGLALMILLLLSMTRFAYKKQRSRVLLHEYKKERRKIIITGCGAGMSTTLGGLLLADLDFTTSSDIFSALALFVLCSSSWFAFFAFGFIRQFPAREHLKE